MPNGDSLTNPFVRSKNDVLQNSPLSAVATNTPLEAIAAQVQRQRISSWMAFSAYSPDNLRFLPQPTPKDLHTPSNTCFTFHDAFEDLLLVWSGRPLRGVVEHALPSEGRQPASFISALSQKYNSWTWRTSIEHQALWDVYFPQQQARLDAKSILEKASKSHRREYHHDHHQDGTSEALVEPLIRQVSMCEEETRLTRILGQLTLPGPADVLHSDRGSLWAALQELDELHDPWLRKVRHTGAHDDDGNLLEDANAEDELYQAFLSRLPRDWPRAALPWDRTTEQRPRCDAAEPSEEESSHSTTTEIAVSFDGSRVVTRTTLRLYSGILERSVTTERQDAQGLVTEHTTNVTRVLSDCSAPSLKNQETIVKGRRPGERVVGGKDVDTAGWFWARGS